MLGLGEVKTESKEPLFDAHVNVGKSALAQLACPNNGCCHSVEKREIKFPSAEVWSSAAERGSVLRARNYRLLSLHQHISFALKVFYLDVLIRVLKSFVPE